MKIKEFIKRYLLLIVCTLLVLTFSFEDIGKKATLTYLLMSVFIIVVDINSNKQRLSNIILFFNSFLYFLCASFEVGHSLLFNDRISASIFFILFETNMGESLEFVQSTFSIKEFTTLGALILTFLYASIQIFSTKSPQILRGDLHLKRTLKYSTLLAISLMIYATRIAFFPYIFHQAIQEYKSEKDALLTLTSQKLGGDFTYIDHTDITEDETYVLVVGESTTKRCLGVYDYYRETTPLLSSISHELKIYNNVITPHTHTIAALDKVLTLKSFKDSTSQNQGSIIQLFNKAGFSTYWLSNQKPIGLFESTVTALSHSADHRVFVNMASNQLDEKLFTPYDNALSDTCSKKLIILHLMGTHLKYEKRYTKNFEIFTEQPITQFKHSTAWKTINSYDNAVAYNDYIIHSFIEKLKQQKGRKFLLYFSDHGEEVYHDKNFAIHAEYDETKDMYDIPFILWASHEFYQDKKYSFDISRKYSIEDLIYSMADLANIDFSPNDITRSVFNPDFIMRKRHITNAKDYDKIYQ